MEWPTKHEHGWGLMHEKAKGWNDVAAMYVPAPMAVIGMIVAFMFGCTLGMAFSKKQTGMGKGYWKHSGMGPMGHHHHGWGEPGCMKSHGGWPKHGKDYGEDYQKQPEEEPADA